MLACCIIFTISCRQAPPGEWVPDPDAVLNVYFFHINERCEACNAIEANTKTVLDKHYRTLIDNGTVKFYSFNVSAKGNRAVTQKYQVSYTSLLLVRPDGTVTDYTNTAFNYAAIDPLKFQDLLKSEIEKNLE